MEKGNIRYRINKSEGGNNFEYGPALILQYICLEFTYVANGEKIMKKSYLEGRENDR